MKPGRNDPCPCGSGRKFKACCGAGGSRDAIDPQPLLALFHGGHFAALEEQLEHLLRQRPQQAFLWSLLGATRQMQGKDGLDALQKATALAPGDAEAHCNLGTALQERGQVDAAEASYKKAAALKPRHLRAHLNLANLLTGSNRLAPAETAFRNVLTLDPQCAEALIGLGEVLTRLNRTEEGERLLRQAIPGPAAAEAYLCLGNLQQKRGSTEEAQASYRAALGIAPNFARAHNNLGNTLLGQGQIDEAIHCFRRALQADPGYAEAYANLGVAYIQKNQFGDAEACYRSAIARQPARGDLRGQLAFALKEQGKCNDARTVYKDWQQLDAHAAEPRLGRAIVELPIASLDPAEAASAAERFGQALEELADWLDSDPAHPAALGKVVGSQQPFHLAYRAGNHAALLGRYGDLIARSIPAAPMQCAVRERIRLAVVSSQVRRHSVWDIVLRGLLANLDRTRFEVVLYHTGSGEDTETTAARSMADIWRDRRQFSQFEGLFDAVCADGPDAILFPEIGMDPYSYRLAAHRLAPLQMASWGHPITTGLPTIDLYLSGELLESRRADAHYREKLVRLPGTGCCTTPLSISAEPIAEIDTHLRQRPGPRFVIAQRAFKADPAHDALYAEIAAATGECTLILLKDPVYPWATAVVRERLETAFRRRGLDPTRHLAEIPWLSAGEFVSLLEVCDVFLDCPAFSGYTTAWQALHAGLPVVTLEGEFLRQRLAAGLLRKAGQTDLIAASAEDYVSIATRLAHESADPAARQARRTRIRNSAPLGDNDIAVVRAFERLVIEELAIRKPRET